VEGNGNGDSNCGRFNTEKGGERLEATEGGSADLSVRARRVGRCDQDWRRSRIDSRCGTDCRSLQRSGRRWRRVSIDCSAPPARGSCVAHCPSRRRRQSRRTPKVLGGSVGRASTTPPTLLRSAEWGTLRGDSRRRLEDQSEMIFFVAFEICSLVFSL
jgi:hypothetical protein